MKTLKNAGWILSLILLIVTSTVSEAGRGRTTNTDPTLHYDANGQPYYIDHFGLQNRPELSEADKGLYYLRYYVHSSVANLGGGHKGVKPRLRVREGMGDWLEYTKNLLIREKDDMLDANVAIAMGDLGNNTELVRATPSKPGQFRNLKIILNSRIKNWTPEMIRGAIARGTGTVIGVPFVNEPDQVMSKNWNGKVYEPGFEDIRQVQKIYGAAPFTPAPLDPTGSTIPEPPSLDPELHSAPSDFPKPLPVPADSTIPRLPSFRKGQ